MSIGTDQVGAVAAVVPLRRTYIVAFDCLGVVVGRYDLKPVGNDCQSHDALLAVLQ